mmetsp:Transcript_10231/g.14811  ORF Transcript_10231/g.14811 Transcript_10231/m.14811 type:complete len:142 (-) Transcript_10231:357-782(-)
MGKSFSPQTRWASGYCAWTTRASAFFSKLQKIIVTGRGCLNYWIMGKSIHTKKESPSGYRRGMKAIGTSPKTSSTTIANRILHVGEQDKFVVYSSAGRPMRGRYVHRFLWRMRELICCRKRLSGVCSDQTIGAKRDKSVIA